LLLVWHFWGCDLEEGRKPVGFVETFITVSKLKPEGSLPGQWLNYTGAVFLRI
jgi:hypothetical protein